MIRVQFKKLLKAAIIPTYESDGSSGMDLYALERTTLEPPTTDVGKTVARIDRVMVTTGIAMALPVGYEGQVRSRSGLAVKHGVVVLHGIGTIDSDYRGEIMVPLVNFGQHVYRIAPGDRIAQLVIAAVERCEIGKVAELQQTSRGDGGFGSTGR